MQTSDGYSTVIIDIGSGIIKSGFGGEDGPRNIFNSIVGIPKMPGIMVSMGQQERFVGDEAISKLEIMNFNAPIQRGQVTDWDKFETLMHYFQILLKKINKNYPNYYSKHLMSKIFI